MTDNIDSALAGLVQADNRSRYAASHGLDFKDGRVLVVIELTSNGSIPAEYDVRIEHRVTVEDGVLVQAYLDVDAIGSLVREPDVRAIRVPESPSTVG